MLPVQPAPPTVMWKPRWAVAIAAVGLSIALASALVGLIDAGSKAGYLGSWLLMFLLLQVGPQVAGGFLLVRFLQRSSLAAFGWGLALVMLTVPMTVAVVTRWVRPV